MQPNCGEGGKPAPDRFVGINQRPDGQYLVGPVPEAKGADRLSLTRVMPDHVTASAYALGVSAALNCPVVDFSTGGEIQGPADTPAALAGIPQIFLTTRPNGIVDGRIAPRPWGCTQTEKRFTDPTRAVVWARTMSIRYRQRGRDLPIIEEARLG